MNIIGISGRKQSGKTTAGEFLEDKIDHAEIVCFADELKDIVCRCFGARTDDLWGSNTDKNKILACGKSAREILQIVGTDWFRSLDPDCWIRAYKERTVPFAFGTIITPDVRFSNEVKCIQDMGGHVIRLLRCPFPDDKHESETALDRMQAETEMYYGLLGWQQKEMVYSATRKKADFIFDAIIDNREMSIEQQNKAVWKLITEKGWIKTIDETLAADNIKNSHEETTPEAKGVVEYEG